ncbi:CMP-N-acetylneuraminate-beta-1,4-galactoside alpha-2,3-sialyltransferase isoform X1 [Amblyraja radiata]|uniref:CMP-N-acetylneuraminate-beta-1,4-galactoside alpha-2,3-sialyltransferase isoform X1 n=1 Tax=Amblyraja radiata TaxID=386614 RepID=UPI0014020DAE|nr:CMP-N-acetylneuraminate-beta-1,4-galactoside alpha-2,3-sialyltransferase isoform X1 [Amblyraja radiata]XP_032884701.1 CMP-N-acetylneuraminate-beta-1,4-galactoside alpha-2,3-sialyltransferase isoform X1 [Amblyraja radiata]
MSFLGSVRNLLLAVCLMLVLGFLYYSAGKLHMHGWGQEPQYDRLGFLLKLDSRMELEKSVVDNRGDGCAFADIQKDRLFSPCLPTLNYTRSAELNYKNGNVTEGGCRKGYASAQMTAIFPKFSKPAPMFLDNTFRRWSKLKDFVPPFGIKGQETVIQKILGITKHFTLTSHLDSLSCKRCIIMGNGGIVANKSLGPRIDEYDVVIRLNEAPVKGFEKDVGTKTTIRITYPEGAIQKPTRYEKDSLFAFTGFKPQDFKWLKYIVYKEKVSPSDGFWKSVATVVPKEPKEIRILNPYFIREAAFTFIGLPVNNGMMGRGNIPTLGTVAITMALHNCDEVAVAGFGYDMNAPNAPLHYYENVKMSAIKESWTHNIGKEKEFLRKLVKGQVITDLTAGI